MYRFTGRELLPDNCVNIIITKLAVLTCFGTKCVVIKQTRDIFWDDRSIPQH